MKLISSALALRFSISVAACPSDGEIIKSVMEKLYADKVLVNYICVENENCDLTEFSSKLDLTKPNINSTSKNHVDALLIEPIKKNTQYFSTLFIKTGCQYRMVFAPDTSLSGIKILNSSQNNLYMIRSLEREANSLWKETDYGYDIKLKQFKGIKVRCYRDENGKSVLRKCE